MTKKTFCDVYLEDSFASCRLAVSLPHVDLDQLEMLPDVRPVRPVARAHETGKDLQGGALLFFTNVALEMRHVGPRLVYTVGHWYLGWEGTI